MAEQGYLRRCAAQSGTLNRSGAKSIGCSTSAIGRNHRWVERRLPIGSPSQKQGGRRAHAGAGDRHETKIVLSNAGKSTRLSADGFVGKEIERLILLQRPSDRGAALRACVGLLHRSESD